MASSRWPAEPLQLGRLDRVINSRSRAPSSSAANHSRRLFSSGTARCQSDGNEADSVSAENSTYVKGITSGRARSLVGVVLALLSIIIAWRAKKQIAVNTKTARPWSIMALTLAIAAALLSIVQLIGTAGGFGTGGGKAGAIIALVLGAVGATLGARGLRSTLG